MPITCPSRPVRALAVAGVAVLALAACSDDAEPPTEGERIVGTEGPSAGDAETASPSADPSATDAAAPSNTAVELLDAGSGAASVLVLAVQEGSVEESVMDMTTTFSVDVQSTESFTMPMRLPLTTRVVAVEGDEMDVEVTYGRPTVRGDLDPATKADMEKGMAFLEGTRMHLTYLPDGSVTESRVDVGDDAPDLAKRMVDDIVAQGSSMSTPFPTEAIGVGARWRATSQLTISGVTVDQVVTYTLESRAGDDYTISFVTEQTQQPGPTLGGEVLEGSTRLTGTTNGRTDLLNPVSMSSTGEGFSKVSVGGQVVRSTYQMKVEASTR